MKTESALVELNQRRRVEERLSFVKKRMHDSLTELSFARGKIPALPKSVLRPPDWALAAAQLSWEKGFAHLRALQVKEKDKSLGDASELFGIYRRLISYVQNAPSKNGNGRVESRGLVALNKTAAKHISKRFIRFIEKINRKFESGPQVPTEAQLLEWTDRQNKGMTSFISAEGEIEALKTKQARIYYLIWFFWPKLVHGFGSGSLHSWFNEEHGEKEISDKTFELAVTELKKRTETWVDHRIQP